MRIKTDIKLTIKDIVKVTGAITTLNGDTEISVYATSSKEVFSGELFIALDGERTSGALYIDEASCRGAITLSNDLRADICVKDTTLALLSIAALYKSKLKELKHTVAVTGSVGKTTTKNMLSEFLANLFKVHATEGNFNNYLGVFFTVLTAPRDTEVLIVEMGMNHSGEISPISRAIEPDTAIITNIGSAHIGNLGSRENIARAKLEICDGLCGKLIIPEGEPLLSNIESRVTVSPNGHPADYSIKINKETADGTNFDIISSSFTAKDLFISEVGESITSALIFTVATLDILGISAEKIIAGISEYSGGFSRGKYIQIGRYLVYDDTYSSSYEAVINDMKILSLSEMKKSCVLGDMLELGDMSSKLHRKIGEAAAKYGFDKLFAFGTYADEIATGALLGGLSEENIFINRDLEKPYLTAAQIMDFCDEGEVILVKASNKVHAERIYDFLN